MNIAEPLPSTSGNKTEMFAIQREKKKKKKKPNETSNICSRSPSLVSVPSIKINFHSLRNWEIRLEPVNNSSNFEIIAQRALLCACVRNEFYNDFVCHLCACSLTAIRVSIYAIIRFSSSIELAHCNKNRLCVL